MEAVDVISGRETELNISTIAGGNDVYSSSPFQWRVSHRPIVITPDEVTISAFDMQVGLPYRFVWGGKEIFALRRDASDRVEFYTLYSVNE